MDSDREGSSVVPESSKGKSQQQSEERPIEEEHYTVILDDEEGGSDPNARITLLNQRTRKPLSVITTEEEFLGSVQKFTSPWLDAIFGLTNSFFNLRDENVVLSDNESRLKEGSRQYKELVNQAGEKVRQLTVDLAKEVEDKERLRQLRDKYRSEAYELREKAKGLQDKLDNLASHDKTPDHNLIIDSDDEDHSLSQPKFSRQATPVGTNRFIPASKSQTPFSTTGSMIEVGKNKKYPDVPLFYGNGDDREKWEGWRLHLESKFRQSAILYTCEQDKIDYIRDHCKDTAFEVIKAKANPTSANAYLTSSEMIQDLENMFGEFDKVAKSDALLHDPKFGMAVANPKETFDEFLARFTSAIAPLDFTDRHKISNLRRTLSERLCFKMADGTTYTSFSQYVSRCRQCDLDLRQADGFSNRNRNDKNKSSSSYSKGQGRQAGNTTGQSKNLNRYRSSNAASTLRSGQLKQRLIKEGRCFKCGKKGHLATDTDAPYKDQVAIPDQQIVFDLKAVEVETASEQHESDSEN